MQLFLTLATKYQNCNTEQKRTSLESKVSSVLDHLYRIAKTSQLHLSTEYNYNLRSKCKKIEARAIHEHYNI
jgi:hypothetical protein